MNLQKTLSQYVPGRSDPLAMVRASWDRLHRIPGGKTVFSKLVGKTAAYTGSIGAHVEELRPGYCMASIQDRPKLRNHLKSVHAIALANLAELTGNCALAYSLPPRSRFIVSRIEIDYVKKARGKITGTCECVIPQTIEKTTYQVPVELRDDNNELVVRAVLHSQVGPINS